MAIMDLENINERIGFRGREGRGRGRRGKLKWGINEKEERKQKKKKGQKKKEVFFSPAKKKSRKKKSRLHVQYLFVRRQSNGFFFEFPDANKQQCIIKKELYLHSLLRRNNYILYYE